MVRHLDLLHQLTFQHQPAIPHALDGNVLRIGQRDAELRGLVMVPAGALAAFERSLPERFGRNAEAELLRCGDQPISNGHPASLPRTAVRSFAERSASRCRKNQRFYQPVPGAGGKRREKGIENTGVSPFVIITKNQAFPGFGAVFRKISTCIFNNMLIECNHQMN